MCAPPSLSTLSRIRSPVLMSLNCKIRRGDQRTRCSLRRGVREGGRAVEWCTHRELPCAVQALDLVYPISHIVELLVEPFFFHNLSRGTEQQQRIWGYIVVDLFSSVSTVRRKPLAERVQSLTSIAIMFIRSKSMRGVASVSFCGPLARGAGTLTF